MSDIFFQRFQLFQLFSNLFFVNDLLNQAQRMQFFGQRVKFYFHSETFWEFISSLNTNFFFLGAPWRSSVQERLSLVQEVRGSNPAPRSNKNFQFLALQKVRKRLRNQEKLLKWEVGQRIKPILHFLQISQTLKSN